MCLREINERSSDVLVVTLYWQDRDNTFAVSVKDAKSKSDFSIQNIPQGEAQDAYMHPFAYEPSHLQAA